MHRWFLITVLFLPSTDGLSQDPDRFFNDANKENLEVLCREFYHPNVIFEDPLVRIEGIEELIAYYQHLYENVISIRFDFSSTLKQREEMMSAWRMFLKHKAIHDGKEEISVHGTSRFLLKDGKVIYHRDYFDLSAFLYEHIPVFGSIVKWVKKKAASHE